MTIMVGLGNPGTKYQNTPHNIGFEAVDMIAKEKGFGDFKLKRKFKAQIAEKGNVILAKPQTYMNNSGESAAKLIKFYKARDLVILHDDIDLPIGKVRISENRGSAGHKGVESIIKELKTKNFKRIRIGIKPEKPVDTEKYVLTKFKKQDKEIIIKSIINTINELSNSREPD